MENLISENVSVEKDFLLLENKNQVHRKRPYSVNTWSIAFYHLYLYVFSQEIADSDNDEETKDSQER